MTVLKLFFSLNFMIYGLFLFLIVRSKWITPDLKIYGWALISCLVALLGFTVIV